MDDKVVPIGRAKEKRNKSDSIILLGIDQEISKLEDKFARDTLRDAWIKATLTLFSDPASPG